jgi:hypothetical protein
MGFKTIFLLFIITIIVQSCEDNNCGIEYNALLDINVKPAKDTFNIGDTILIECKSSIVLEDYLNGSKTNFKNVRFNVYCILSKYYDTATWFGSLDNNFGVNDFYIIPIIGEIQKVTLNTIKINPILTDDSLSFIIKIIPKKRGLQAFSIVHDPLKNNKGQTREKVTNTECAEYFTLLPRINKGNINLNLTNHIDTFVPITPKSKISYFNERNSGYYFYVK